MCTDVNEVLNLFSMPEVRIGTKKSTLGSNALHSYIEHSILTITHLPADVVFLVKHLPRS